MPTWRTFLEKAASVMTDRTEPTMVCTGTYGPLYTYLRGRFAQRIAMTFEEVESLLGFALPAVARTDRAWWSGTDPFEHRSPHADAWMMANCVATVNLQASTVVFERRAVSARR